VGFLDCKTGDLGAKVGLRDAESWKQSQIYPSKRQSRNTYIVCA
jgi:hypothetical protein